MAKQNYQVGMLITGNAKGGVKATQLTRDGLKDLSTQQKKTGKSTKDLTSKTGSMIGKLGKVTGAIGLVTATLGSMGAVMRTQTITEMKVMADTLNLSTQTLSEWTVAGEKFQVSGEKTADIFKDIQDKIGDLAATGGGEAKDIFEKLNLDINEFVGLSADQQLLKVGAALDDVASHSEKIFYLEALANDASRLLPLLENGAFGLKTAQEEARLLGTSINDIDAEMIAAAGREMQRMGDISTGLGNTITAAVAPALGIVNTSVMDVVLSFGGWENIVKSTIDTTIAGVGFVLDRLKPLHVMLLTSQLGWLQIGQAATSAMASSAQITADVINTVLEPFQALLWGIADGWGQILTGLGEFTGDSDIIALGASLQGFAHDVSQFSVSADDIVAADKAMSESITNTKDAIVLAKGATRGNDLVVWHENTTKAAKETAKATVAVKEAQRDLGNVVANNKGAGTSQLSEDYEKLIKQVDDFSGAWASAGNVIVDTFGSIGQQMEKLFASQDKYAEMLKFNQAEQAKGGKNLKQLKAEEIKLNYASTQAQLSSYGAIAGATADMFGEKTKAAKAFHAIEQIMAVASLAMSIEKMVMGTTETGVHIANETTKQGANALTAITSAFSAPFPLNFAAGAAMIAIMASLLGGSFGGGGGSAGNGTGSASTVKGGGISESLSKANDGLEDIMIDQLAELRGLRSDITNVQNLSYGLLDSLLNVDVGHHEIKNATERELEGSIRGLNTGVASGVFTDELSAIFDGIDEAIEESVDVLGLKTKSSLANFVFEVGTISFDGLDADKAGERLDQILSAQSDLMVESIAPFITEYQKLGEGALETLVRVAQEQTVFNDTLDKLGMSLSDLSEVMQIDVAQSLIDLTGGFDKFSELSGSFFDNFFTDAERFEFLEKSLTETFDSLGLSMVSSKKEFRALIEGFDLTTESGQELFAALLEVNPAFAEYTDSVEEQNEAVQEAIEYEKELAAERMHAISSLKSDINQLVDDLIAPDYQSLIREEEQRWKNQQDAADNLYKTEMKRYEGALNAERTLDEYINGLAFGDKSTLSLMQQHSLAKVNFRDDVKRAESGDFSAVSDSTGSASQLLDIVKERYGGDSESYRNMFSYVNSTLSDLSDFYADFEAPDQQIIEESAELLGLREQLATSQALAEQAENQALADLLTSQLSDLSDLSGDSIDSLIESFSIDLSSLGELLSVNLIELIEVTKQGINTVPGEIINNDGNVVVPVDNVIAFPEINNPIAIQTPATTDTNTANNINGGYSELVAEVKLLRKEIADFRGDSNDNADVAEGQRDSQTKTLETQTDEIVRSNFRQVEVG